MAPPRRARKQKSRPSSARARPDGRRIVVIIVAVVVIIVLVLALVLSVVVSSSNSSAPQQVGTFNPQIHFEIACGGCHANGPGPHLSGPSLIKTFPNIQDQINFVANGKGGMPPQKNAFTADQLRQIVEYTRTLP
jgi:mono/diheme cytochrome c family protein